MRVVSLRDAIVWPAFSLLGYDPRVDLLTDLADASARSVNAWARKTWDAADWNELSRTETRTPVNHLVPYDVGITPPPNWLAAVTYNKDSVVRDPNNLSSIYISLQNANVNHALSQNVWWLVVSAWDPTKTYLAGSNTTPSSTIASLVSDPVSGIVYVAQQAIVPDSVLSDSLRNTNAWLPNYQQQQAIPNITNIGKILKVYMVDPTIFSGPFDIPFKEYDTAFHVGFRHGPKVWVKFMTRPSQYTFTVWSATTTYNQYSTTNFVSDLAYNAAVGECFSSAQPGNLNHPLPTGPVNNAWWNFVPFPSVLADVVKRGLYSDLLRDEGETGKAQAEEQGAMADLQSAVERNTMTRYDKITDQQTGVPRYQSMVSTGAS
jgi:hypothetical protein